MTRIRRLVYAILDGTLTPIDRVDDQKPYYSGCEARRLVWASPALPGAVHDLTAARTHDITSALTSAEVMTFADRGYQGAGGSVRTPFKRHRRRRRLSRREKAVNRSHARPPTSPRAMAPGLVPLECAGMAGERLAGGASPAHGAEDFVRLPRCSVDCRPLLPPLLEIRTARPGCPG